MPIVSDAIAIAPRLLVLAHSGHQDKARSITTQSFDSDHVAISI
jgi:hypothetical protein